MTTTSHILSFETIYDKLSSDLEEANCPSEDVILTIIEELCFDGVYLIEQPYDDNYVSYSARPGLQWPDFSDLDNPVKKQILLYLVDNPKTFFVLYNTQKGKSRISSIEMRKWAEDSKNKIVAFVIVDNDKTLADQSASGFKSAFPGHEVFTLSSNSSININHVISYTDAYSTDRYDKYKMPIILALQNDAQISRIVTMLSDIQRKANHTLYPSNLRYGILVDEADKTYPPIRNRLLPFIRDPVALHRIGFVTATDGDLLDLEDFEECCNAQLYQADSDSPDYIAMHTDGSEIHCVELSSKKQKPNDYAEKVIRENGAHFNEPILLSSGESYYRKVIVNGNTSVSDMKAFAADFAARGWYALTFNQTGICLYRPGGRSAKRYKTKGRRLNEMLMCIYKIQRLNDRPLIVVGRRKVDRGLGFHYAPRSTETNILKLEEDEIWIENGDGIIFTDLILGHVEDKNTATQKAGRAAGIIAHCPQYPGKIHYWTDERTSRMVIHHNKVVDAANALPGAHSALQATTRAREQVREPESAVAPLVKYVMSQVPLYSKETAKKWCEDNCSYTFPVKDKKTGETKIEKYGSAHHDLYKMREDRTLEPATSQAEATHIKWCGDPREIQTEDEFRRATDLSAGGVNTKARIVPVRRDDSTEFGYVVVYKNRSSL